MSESHEETITKANTAKAVRAFARDQGELDTYGSLLGYLLAQGRVDEAALLVDAPGQVVSKTLNFALQALQRRPASFPLFEAIVARRPPLYRSEHGDEAVAHLFLGRFHHEQEDLCLRVVRTIAEAYGHEGTLARGGTLLHDAAGAGLHGPIAYLVGRGASLKALDTMDRTPFAALFAGRCGWLQAETIALLQRGAPPKEALGAFLSMTPEERPLAEIQAAVAEILRCGASVEARFNERSPLAHALLLERPTADRRALAEQLVAAGASYATALPGVVTMHRPAQLVDALAFAQARPGAVYGKAKQTLLHLAAATLESDDYVDEDQRADERSLPVLSALLALGEALDARDARGKTPLDLARKHRAAFPAKDFERITALLGGSAPAPKKSAAVAPPRVRPPAKKVMREAARRVTTAPVKKSAKTAAKKTAKVVTKTAAKKKATPKKAAKKAAAPRRAK